MNFSLEQFLLFLVERWPDILVKSGEHLYISFVAVSFGAIVAIPLGILLTRINKNVANGIITVVALMQTLPSLALLGFVMAFTGPGEKAAIFALFIYSLLPLLQNTYTGMNKVDPSMIEAGKGMGMKQWELIRYVELPVAFPVIMAGLRISTVYIISWATLAAFIGGGGLGDFIFTGLGLYNINLILAGAIPSAILAVLTDYILGKVEWHITPSGLRKNERGN